MDDCSDDARARWNRHPHKVFLVGLAGVRGLRVGLDVEARQPFRIMILLAAIFVSIWFYSRWVLFGIALIYMFSGVWWRLQWIVRRRPSPPAPPAYQEASQHP